MRFYEGISSALMGDEGLKTILTACIFGKRQNEEYGLSFWNGENIARMKSRYSNETERMLYERFRVSQQEAASIYLLALTMEMGDACPDVW